MENRRLIIYILIYLYMVYIMCRTNCHTQKIKLLKQKNNYILITVRHTKEKVMGHFDIVNNSFITGYLSI